MTTCRDVIDRTAISAWEDEDFVAAIKATGRKKLIRAALWTGVCLVHPEKGSAQLSGRNPIVRHNCGEG